MWTTPGARARPVWSHGRVEEKGAAAPSRTASGGPPTGTPHLIGPYAVNGRWYHDDSGQVLSARDGTGRDVEVVLLAPGPAGDPAARDRFTAAAEQLGRENPGRLVATGSGLGLTWAALASGSGPALARPLLDAVTAPGARSAPSAGPDFAPHWSGSHAAYPAALPPPVPAPPSAPPSRRRWWWLAVALLVVLLLLLLAACWPSAGGGEEPGPSTTTTGSPVPSPSPSGTESGPTPSPSGSGDGPSGPSGSPSPSNSAGGEAVPQQPLATGPGLGGEQFGPDEPTTELRLADLPFPFRVPEGWQCVRSTDEIASVLYLCMDFDAVAREPMENHASGVIELTACDDVCDQQEWAALRALRSDDVGYDLVDAGTLLSEDEDPWEDGFRRIRMSRVYDPAGTPEPRVHVYVEFSAPAEEYPEVRRVVDDVRVNTP
jgi:hypothetical protein